MDGSQLQDQQQQTPNMSNLKTYTPAKKQQTIKFPIEDRDDKDQKARTCYLKPQLNKSRQILSNQILRSMLNQINYWIYNVGDRNKVYKCNYIHLLMPLAITIKLLQIEMISSKNTYIKILLNAIIKKINQRQQMLLQISDKKYREEVFNNFLKLIINRNANQKDLIKFLRNFLLQNKEIMIAFMPYYYNFFALVINKEDLFMSDKPTQALLQYTIDFKHDKFYNKDFKRSDIEQMIKIFEEKLTQKYHCTQSV